MEGENKLAFFGDKFVDCEMDEIADGAACIQGYKLVVIFYNASWCGQGCGNIRATLKYAYPEWNKDGQKNVQIGTVSMDRT